MPLAYTRESGDTDRVYDHVGACPGMTTTCNLRTYTESLLLPGNRGCDLGNSNHLFHFQGWKHPMCDEPLDIVVLAGGDGGGGGEYQMNAS